MATSGIASRNVRRCVEVRNPRHRPLSISGTPTFTANDTAVTGGTAFLSELSPGDLIKKASDAGEYKYMEVLSVESDSALTLKGDYLGTTGAGAAVARKKIGRQLSPLPQGAYVNAGDAGFGRQEPRPPGSVMRVDVTPQNMFALRSAVDAGDLEVAGQLEAWYDAGQKTGGENGAVIEFQEARDGLRVTGVEASTAGKGISVPFKSFAPSVGAPGAGADITLDIEYSSDNGANWANATRLGSEGDVAQNGTVVPTVAGLDSEFVWDAGTDLGGTGTYENVRVRITAAYDNGSNSAATPDIMRAFTVVVD